MKLIILIKRAVLRLLCKLGLHKAIKTQPHPDGEIYVICRRCRKELE